MLARRIALVLVLLSAPGCHRRVPYEDVFSGPPAPVEVESAVPVRPVAVANPQSWDPPFQMLVDDAWVYFSRCADSEGRCEVGRAPVDGGTEEPLVRGRVNTFAVGPDQLILFQSRELLRFNLLNGHRQTLAQAQGIPMQVGVSGKRIFWTEANPASFSFIESDDEAGTQQFDHLDIPTLFAVEENEVFVVDGDRETGRVDLSRLSGDSTDPGVRMRVDQFGSVPSSLRVVGPTLYWASMDRAGNSHLWTAPRAFTNKTRPDGIIVNGLGLGVHDLGVRGDSLYFLDSKGVGRAPLKGGDVQRPGIPASALAAGPGGVFIGLMDGGVQRLDDVK